MKKCLAAFLAVLMVLNLSVTALAVSLTPAADKETITAGDSVTVSVKTDEEIADVSTAELRLYFDDTKFEWDKENSKAVADNISFYAKACDNNGRKYVRILFIAESTGKATLGTDKLAEVVFKAKADVTEAAQASFSSYIAKLAVYGADPETDVSIEASTSVTVTPASTEPGYTVAASAVSTAVTVGDTAQVTLTVGNTGSTVTAYNAYDMTVTYNADVLKYDSVADVNGETPNVVDNNGTLRITGYGSNKTCGTHNIVLSFTSKITGSADVTVTSAKVDAKDHAIANDAPEANITAKTVTIKVGGYQVTLHEAFTGEGTANHGQDYTFNAKDPSKKYDFTGSTMGGKDVEVIDNGNGTYTVKNVSGELVIKATEKAGKVTINLSGDAVDTITQKSWGTATEVDAGTALWFMAQPESGKELVVTVNGEVVAGMNMQAFMRYNIAADKVTGTALNIVVSYKAADQATIIESGTAWNKVKNLSRGGWEKSGDKVDAGTTLDLYFKPEDGKTIDDYVVRANGMDCTYAKVGKRYKFTIPATIITAGATVTINFDYAATPEPTVTVDVREYVKLNGQSIFLITATGENMADGQVLAYGDNQMYWSAKYNESKGAYAWLVISNKTLEEIKTAAAAQVKAVTGTKVEIAYTGDVNLTGNVDINDAQLVWNMYNAEYSDFTTVNVRKFLEADMTADGTLDTSDAVAVTDIVIK